MTLLVSKRHQSLPVPHRTRGIALVVVLCLVVLLSGLVLAYFSQVTATRQVSDSSLNQNKADELARSALEIVVGDLKQEIANPNNSTTVPAGAAAPQATVYTPLTAASMLPMRSGNPSGSPDAANLVRRSWSADSNLYYSSKASAVNSTTDASTTGCTISATRWNSHYLLPRPAGANPTDSTPISNFTAPDWVFVTNAGPVVLTAPSAAVLGRYAYAIYDEGGLLDVNTAGYPTQATPDQYSYKTALAYADLQRIGMSSTAVDDLVGWRNYASVQPTGSFGNFSMPNAAQWTNFANLVTQDTAGFLKINSGNVWNSRTDQAFLSRQQLLKFRASEGFSAYALPYLGTFSRDVAAPSWLPSRTSTPNTDYFAIKDTASSANRDTLLVRVPTPLPGGTPFTRADGTIAQLGEPLLKHRFPLNRLGEIAYNGVSAAGNTTLVNGVPAPATAATVQRDFGLIWNTDHWEYWGSTGTAIQSSIATLGTIADHEPNFFELLKAGMLRGSLGRGAGAVGTYNTTLASSSFEEGPASGIDADDTNADLQVIRIGANVIDQFDTDSYPTEIWFNNPATSTTVKVYGIENLPYLQRVFAKTLYYPQGYLYGCYMAEVWSPHQLPLASATVTPAPPTQFQFSGEGQAQMWGYYYPSPTPGSAPATTPGQNVTLDTTASNGGSGSLVFNVTWGSTVTRDPTILTDDPGNPPYLVPTVTSGGNGTNVPTGWGNVIPDVVCGLYAGTLSTGGSRNCGIVPGALSSPAPGSIVPAPGTNASLVLKYLVPGTSTYKVYQRMKNFAGTEQDDAYAAACYYVHPDPRTDRFGTSIGKWTYDPASQSPGQSIRVNTGVGWNLLGFFPRPGSNFVYPNTMDSSIYNAFYPGMLSDNLATSPMHYLDPDGVQRAAAGAYSTSNDGRPLIPGNANSRPIILNRPFRNVGELGYAYRDMPWKNIDFFTANSADGALLDLFCVQENLNERGLTAGQVNLNTRQPLVLQAIISAAMKDEVNATPLSGTDANRIATAITTLTASTPLINKSELLVKAALALAPGGSTDQQIKIRREAALRALSDVGQTRTWNLLIDVIAQSGRYAPATTDVKKFTVKGEKRYWLHVAIDRYTGEVIDRMLEPVYE